MVYIRMCGMRHLKQKKPKWFLKQRSTLMIVHKSMRRRISRMMGWGQHSSEHRLFVNSQHVRLFRRKVPDFRANERKCLGDKQSGMMQLWTQTREKSLSRAFLDKYIIYSRNPVPNSRGRLAY